MDNTPKSLKGFTLIELMIVVAIIGILAAISIPQYQIYVTRSKMVEVTTNLDADKIAVAESFTSNGAFPATAPFSTVLPANAHYVTAVAYNTTGAAVGIVMTVGNTGSAMDGQLIGLFGVGNTADGTVTWTCGTAAAGGTTPAATTANYAYLPGACQH